MEIHIEKLKKLKEESKFSNRHIADMMNEDEGNMSNYLSGKRLITSAKMQDFADLFEVSVEYLNNDSIEIAENAALKYPKGWTEIFDVLSREVEELREKIKTIDGLDEEFKKDAKCIITEIEETSVGYKKIINVSLEQLREFKSPIARNIFSSQMINGILVQSTYEKDILKVIKLTEEIVNYLDNSDGIKFYEAYKNLISIKNIINSEKVIIDKSLSFLDYINKIYIKIEEFNAIIISPIVDEIIDVINGIDDKILKNEEFDNILYREPNLDDISICMLYLAICYKIFYSEISVEKSDLFIQKINIIELLKQHFINDAYDDNDFLLDSKRDTFEKLYKLIVDSIDNDEVIFKFIDNAMIIYKENSDKWYKIFLEFIRNTGYEYAIKELNCFGGDAE